MSLKTPLLFAGAIIAIAVLAVVDIVTEEFAQYRVILFPALAAIHIAHTGRGRWSKKMRG